MIPIPGAHLETGSISKTMSGQRQLLDLADGVAELVARDAETSERRGELTEDVVEAIKSSGLAGMGLPAALGGLASPPVVMAEVLERIAAGDAAASWVVMVASTASLTAAYLDPVSAKRVWDEGSHTLTAGVLAPKGRAIPTPDGYRVTGRWPFASGILHASWISGGVMIEGRDGIVHTAFMPTSAVEVVDTWDVVGLSGTGSHDFEATEVEVPRELVTSLDTTEPWTDEPLYRFPIYGMLAAGVAAVTLGIARGAISDLVGLATAKVPTGSKRSLAERPLVQEEVARANAGLAASRAYLHETMERSWEEASSGNPLTARDRAELRMAATWAVETSADVVQSMYRTGGGTSIYRRSVLQRRLRDVNAATQHMMVARPTWEVAGRVLLGIGAEHVHL